MKHAPKRDEPDWTPRRRGAIYCAPACGANCTWKAYQQAKSGADKMVATLGKGWVPWVFDNLGWHHQAIVEDSEGILMSVSRHGSHYMALVSYRWSAWATTPRAAVKKAVLLARAELDALTARVELIEDRAKGGRDAK